DQLFAEFLENRRVDDEALCRHSKFGATGSRNAALCSRPRDVTSEDKLGGRKMFMWPPGCSPWVQIGEPRCGALNGELYRRITWAVGERAAAVACRACCAIRRGVVAVAAPPSWPSHLVFHTPRSQVHRSPAHVERPV